MSLILDHINGINNDHRIENLRIVCPNCEGTLVTHCRKNKDNEYTKKISKNREEKIKICACGKKINIISKSCKECSRLSQRKTLRPSYLELVEELKTSNYSVMSRKYGVSDNAIRKWVKQYEKNLNN